MINLRLVGVGIIILKSDSAVETAPPTLPVPPMTDDTLVETPGDGSLTVTWTIPPTMPATAIIRVWGESYQVGMHKQLLGYENVTEETVNIDSAKFAQGKTNVLTAHIGLYRLQCDVIANKGQLSVPSTVFEIVNTIVP